MSIFDSVKSAMPKAEKKAPAVPLMELAEAESLEALGAQFAEAQAQHKYVTFASVAKAMGYKGAFRPSCIPVLLKGVEQIDVAYQALIVNGKGQHAPKVAEQHHATLEGMGYTQFPEVIGGKVEDREVI